MSNLSDVAVTAHLPVREKGQQCISSPYPAKIILRCLKGTEYVTLEFLPPYSEDVRCKFSSGSVRQTVGYRHALLDPVSDSPI